MSNASEMCEVFVMLTNIQKFLRLGMRNFLGIVIIWTQTYRKIFKSALVY